MKAYTIFDDFGEIPVKIMQDAGIDITVHPYGVPRPDNETMKKILENNDCVIIGTSQKISEDMFENIDTPRIIATASVGLDHIQIPEEKQELVIVINTPKANAQSVAEYTFGCALACCKRLEEGKNLYLEGKNNKNLYRKPEDLNGKVMGVVGAGNISAKIIDYAVLFGMTVVCWTAHPQKHMALADKGIKFVELEGLCKTADVISVNLPNHLNTKGIISASLVSVMKESAIFISVSRLETVDVDALLDKAIMHSNFYVCLDVDVNQDLCGKLSNKPNLIVTPHIAGGTVETRKRMFRELAECLSRKVS